ncbi:hypothetical protein ACFLZX_04750 [Nanoarchaeota archaeon]
MFLKKIVNLKKGELVRKSYTCKKAKHAFVKALKSKKISIIAEIKSSSPSKGVIKKNFNLENVARVYDKSNVQAISVLTEKNYFGGSIEFIQRVRKVTKKPILRKDFIIDENQIYESRYYGADAILLIGEILSLKQINRFVTVADDLGMDVIVEAHELSALKKVLKSKAKIIGINNRDLNSLEMDMRTVERLAPLVKNKILVAESGYSSKIDLALLPQNVQSVLIGSSIMGSFDIVKKLESLKDKEKIVKICGNTNIRDARIALESGADLIGLIINVKKSKDSISITQAKEFLEKICRTRIVAVTLTKKVDEIVSVCKNLNPGYIQIHDELSVAGVKKIRKMFPNIKIIKSVIVRGKNSLKEVRIYEPHADLILLDSGAGSGRIHDWSLSKEIVGKSKRPVILAGGLNPNNVAKAIKSVRPFGVDVNSGVKLRNRVKDPKKIKKFIKNAK